MVLEDLENASQGSANDSSDPSNDFQPAPYLRGNHDLDVDQFPKKPWPLPIFNNITGYTQSDVRSRTEQSLNHAEAKIGRAFSREEANALASHLYGYEGIKQLLTATGAAYGGWTWWKTMPINRYPFYTPKPENVNPEKFWFVRGPQARIARQSWRLTLFWVTWTYLGGLAGQIVGAPSFSESTAKDPKLAEFVADLERTRNIERQAHERSRVERYQNTYKKNPDGSPVEYDENGKPKPPPAGATLPPHAGQPGAYRTPRPAASPAPPRPAATPSTGIFEDDMSPTAGNDPWAPAQPQNYDWSGSQNQEQSRQDSDSMKQFDRGSQDNDASPTGGMFQDEVRGQPKPGESAWDRLRRGAAAPNRTETPHKEQRQGLTESDRFSFSDSDEERRRGQDRAQREFDERIERERQGRDFNDNNRRW